MVAATFVTCAPSAKRPRPWRRHGGQTCSVFTPAPAFAVASARPRPVHVRMREGSIADDLLLDDGDDEGEVEKKKGHEVRDESDTRSSDSDSATGTYSFASARKSNKVVKRELEERIRAQLRAGGVSSSAPSGTGSGTETPIGTGTGTGIGTGEGEATGAFSHMRSEFEDATDSGLEEDEGSSAFAHMRAEFESATDEDKERTQEATGKKNDNGKEEEEEEVLRPQRSANQSKVDKARARQRTSGSRSSRAQLLSGGDVARRIAGLPLAVVRNVVSPTADVLGVLWYDARVRLDEVGHDAGAVVKDDEMTASDYLEDEAWIEDMRRTAGQRQDLDGLSEEERQVAQLEEMAGQAVQTSRRALARFASWLAR